MIPYIYLLDRNSRIIKAWENFFAKENKVEIVKDEFTHFMDTHCDVDGVVSPANSFGLMDGGYDKAISTYFGRKELHKAVQEKLQKEYLGEQPVGNCMKVDIPGTDIVLLHSPSMREPQVILDPTVIYHCMRSTLITAIEHNIKTLVVPAFGGRTGGVPGELLGDMMYQAYKDAVYREAHKYTNTWKNIRTKLSLDVNHLDS